MAKFITKKNVENLKQLVKYGFWGVVCTIINLILFYFLIYLHIEYLMANILSYIVAVILSYYLNKKFVFDNVNKSNRAESIQTVKYFFVRILSIAADSSFLWILVDVLHINVYISKIVSSIVVILGTFVINKVWVFKKNATASY